MHTTHLWHQLRLLRRKTGLTAILCLLAAGAFAQDKFAAKKPEYGLNLPNYDERWLHYGFYIGPNYSRFNVRHSRYFARQQNPDVRQEEGQERAIFGMFGTGGVGFSVGFISSLRLGEHFDLRLTPGVSFHERTVRIEHETLPDDEPTDAPFSEDVQFDEGTFSYLELPLLLKFKSRRRGNVRMYTVGGIKPSFEVGGKRNQNNADLLRAGFTNLCIDYGVGFDLYFELFKFAPELRFSHGLTNLIDSDIPGDGHEPYTRSVARLSTHTVTLFLNFE